MRVRGIQSLVASLPMRLPPPPWCKPLDEDLTRRRITDAAWLVHQAGEHRLAAGCRCPSVREHYRCTGARAWLRWENSPQAGCPQEPSAASLWACREPSGARREP